MNAHHPLKPTAQRARAPQSAKSPAALGRSGGGHPCEVCNGQGVTYGFRIHRCDNCDGSGTIELPPVCEFCDGFADDLGFCSDCDEWNLHVGAMKAQVRL